MRLGTLTTYMTAVVTAILVGAARPLVAQDVAHDTASRAPGVDATDAIRTITAADVARHLEMLTHDSLRVRDTPSHELEQVARYVARQFQAFGLEPNTGDSGMIQRYALPGHVPLPSSGGVLFVVDVKRDGRAVVDEVGKPVQNSALTQLGTAMILASDTVLDSRAPGAQGHGQGALRRTQYWSEGYGPRPVVVAGPHTLTSLRQANVHDRVVVYVPPVGLDSAGQRPLVELLAASNHVIIVADEDSATFAARSRAAAARPPVLLDRYAPEAQVLRRWAVYMWASALRSALATAGVDLVRTGTAPTPLVREVPAVARLMIVPGVMDSLQSTDSTRSAPNVVGVLRGTDPPDRVIVLTAHMDTPGPRPGPAARRAPSLAPSADDNAAGVAGLLVLAQAFAQAAKDGAPLRDWLVFAAVSGGTKDLWGSTALLDNWHVGGQQPAPVLNLDQLGQVAGDSVAINGLREVALAVRPEWIAAQHPDLRLRVVDGGSVVAPTSDHFAFVRWTVPSLYIHGVAPETGAASSDHVDAEVDAEQEARVLRFVFHLGRELANASRLPQWTAEGREQRARVLGE